MGCGQGHATPQCMGSAVNGPRACTCTRPTLWVQFSDDGWFIRKWAFAPFDGADEYLPSQEQTDDQ